MNVPINDTVKSATLKDALVCVHLDGGEYMRWRVDSVDGTLIGEYVNEVTGNQTVDSPRIKLDLKKLELLMPPVYVGNGDPPAGEEAELQIRETPICVLVDSNPETKYCMMVRTGYYDDPQDAPP
jgi:hypothetical protein